MKEHYMNHLEEIRMVETLGKSIDYMNMMKR